MHDLHLKYCAALMVAAEAYLQKINNLYSLNERN